MRRRLFMEDLMFNRYTLGVMLIGVLFLGEVFLANGHHRTRSTPPQAATSHVSHGAWDVVIGPGYVRAKSVPVPDAAKPAGE